VPEGKEEQTPKLPPIKSLITVIMAVRNSEKHIEGTILSVTNQTYDNVEFIVIDGGSVDKTMEIVNRHKNRIDYWISEPDKGIYDAWNKGMKRANGEWIAFLGAGDVFSPNAIELYLNSIADSNTTLDLISSRINLIDPNGRSLRLWGKPFAWKAFKKAMEFAHVGAFHHRSLFERYGLFDISYKSAGDYEFFMRCGRHLRTRFIDAVTVDVLVGGISMDSSGSLKETCQIQIKYGRHPLVARYYYSIARVKQKLRPLLRGY